MMIGGCNQDDPTSSTPSPDSQIQNGTAESDDQAQSTDNETSSPPSPDPQIQDGTAESDDQPPNTDTDTSSTQSQDSPPQDEAADPENRPPNAKITAPEVLVSGETVTLDGSGSFDPDGNTISYKWTQTKGQNITLSDSTSSSLTFVAPTVSQDTKYTFQLTVDDGQLSDTAIESVQISPVVDNDLPSIVSRSPKPDQGKVSTTAEISASFDEALREDSVDSQSLLLSQNGSQVAGVVSYDSANNTVTNKPTSPLSPGVTYTATLADTLEDLSGNAFAGESWSFSTAGADEDSDGVMIGWAANSACGQNGTTGGGNGEPTVTVTSGSELKRALTSGDAQVIAVSGRMDSPGKIGGVHDKTLIGINDAEIMGDFGINGSRNVIIKNIKFSDGSDDTFELSGSQCVWFDHCEFRDGADGNLDIVRASDYVTVSWSKFYYTKGHGHMFSNLCGNGQPRESDVGKINITFHHNLWGAGCNQRMPRVRYGKVHVFNNYYHYEKVSGDSGSNYAVGGGIQSKLLVENNYFEGIGKAFKWMYDEGTGEVVARGNVLVNTGGDFPSRGSSFDPPYDYSLDDAEQVKELVKNNAGVR